VNLEARIRLWNLSHIHIFDIRRSVLHAEDHLPSYLLPSSAFLYVLDGQALIEWDEERIKAKPKLLLHGGKGLRLAIAPMEEFHYCIILYKAVLPKLAHRERLRFLESGNPFYERYSIMANQPLYMVNKLLEMEKQWNKPGARSKLLARSCFYQFVHEVLSQLEAQGVNAAVPDLALQAVRYIEEHYSRPITLEELSDLLDCSSRMLLRKFKAEFETSPIDYLIQVRMEKAKQLLSVTHLTIREIAESTGYADHYYFSRLFKKHAGIPPAEYRSLVASGKIVPYDPSALSTLSIVGNKLQRYIDEEINNHYQYKVERELNMYGKSRRSLAILIICMAMLLSACGGGTSTPNTAKGNNSSGNSAISSSANTQATTETQESAPASRTIKHAMGEETIVGTPERIVILTNEGTEALLSVGVKPVGAVQSWVGDPWYEHIATNMEGVEVVGDELQPNIELIASLKPDLIIGNKVRQEKVYEQLKQIAPTVFSDDLAGDWKINFSLYMETIGKQEEGNRLMAEFDKRVEEAKAKLADKLDTKVSVARFSASQVRIYQKQTFSGVLLNQLGFARPESQDVDNFIEVMSKETIPSMDGDVLFYFVTEKPGSQDASKATEEWMNDPLFKNLNVAKNNKVIQVDEAIWNTAGGYKAANLLLDEIVAYFGAEK